jgi:hypothetical protein
MFSSSLSYERMVLSHLEKVQHLPTEVQTDIAMRVGNCMKIARGANNEAFLARLASGAMEEQAKAIGQGAKSTMEPRWAAPALAEAWCYAMMSLSNGNLDRSSATAIITAIERFVLNMALSQ